ncbi:MAG: ABC transporter permease [Actinomycetota bacterium]|nr:ABC transporter permease [Actinomycetota bacterium]
MTYLWDQLRAAVPLIGSGSVEILATAWLTIRVALVSTGIALIIGLPLGLAIGLGRFRGRRLLHILANASLALPPVLAGVFILLVLLPQGPLGSLHIAFSLKAVYVVQTILALPYIVALTPAAIQGLPPGLLAQARMLGAGRLQLSRLALREAKIGVLAAVIAALGTALSEVAAIIVVGGNIEGHDQTLASAIVSQIYDYGNYPAALAIGIVLLALIVLLMGVLTVLQQRTTGVQLRFRAAP